MLETIQKITKILEYVAKVANYLAGSIANFPIYPKEKNNG
jgi:hypothetical protein